MGVTSHLVFDVTDATSILASSNVGSWTRAGTDGDLIDSQLIAATEWLQVASATFDGSGNPITSTTGWLDVNIAGGSLAVNLDGVFSGGNPDPDNVGVIAHVRSATPADADQTFRSTGGAASSDAVVAANVQGLDVNGFNMIYNGTTWDRLRGTSGAVFINDGGNSITVDGTVAVTQSTSPWVVSDAALANTAIAADATTVGVTLVAAIAAPLANRKYAFFYNNGNKGIYIGTAGTTTATGFPMYPGMAYEFRAGAAIDIRAIADGAGQNMRHLELS